MDDDDRGAVDGLASERSLGPRAVAPRRFLDPDFRDRDRVPPHIDVTRLDLVLGQLATIDIHVRELAPLLPLDVAGNQRECDRRHESDTP